MEISIKESFIKDVKGLPQDLLAKIALTIQEIENAPSIRQVVNCKKLSGHKTFYRIRIGNYRMGINIIDGTVYMVRFLPRKDVYKYFP